MRITKKSEQGVNNACEKVLDYAHGMEYDTTNLENEFRKLRGHLVKFLTEQDRVRKEKNSELMQLRNAEKRLRDLEEVAEEERDLSWKKKYRRATSDVEVLREELGNPSEEEQEEAEVTA